MLGSFLGQHWFNVRLHGLAGAFALFLARSPADSLFPWCAFAFTPSTLNRTHSRRPRLAAAARGCEEEYVWGRTRLNGGNTGCSLVLLPACKQMTQPTLHDSGSGGSVPLDYSPHWRDEAAMDVCNAN